MPLRRSVAIRLCVAYCAITAFRLTNAQWNGERCSSCTIRALKSKEVDDALYNINSNLPKISAVEIRLAGLNLSAELWTGSTIYDPSWWLWAPSDDIYFFNVPALDMDVLSFNTLKISVRNVTINLEDEPMGCAATLDRDCVRSKYAQVLLQKLSPIRHHFIDNRQKAYPHAAEQDDPERADLLCESHFLVETASLPGWDTVGWRCLVLTTSTINQLQNNATELAALQKVSTRQDLHIVFMVIGMVLAFILISALGLYRWLSLPLLLDTTAGYRSFGKFDPRRSSFYELRAKEPKEDKRSRLCRQAVLQALSDATNSCEVAQQQCPSCVQLRNTSKLLSDQQQAKCKHWLLLHENALMNYSPTDPFWRLWQHLHVHSLKAATTLFYALLVTMVTIWTVRYREKAELFSHLRTGKQIYWNLNAIAASWFFVDSSTWPYVAAWIMHILLAVALLPPFVFGLIDTARFILRRCAGKKCKDKYRQTWMKGIKKWLEKDNGQVIADCSWLKNALFVYQVTSLLPFYAVLCNICYCFIYTLLGIMVHIQTTAPFVTGSVLAVYYTGRSVKGIANKYTLLKGALFEVLLKEISMKGEKIKASKFYSTLRKCSTDFVLSYGEYDSQIVFFGEDGDELHPKLTFKLLRKIAKTIAPFGSAIAMEALKLCSIAITTLFIMLTFNKTLSSNMAIFLTAIVSVLSAMLPKLIELFSTRVGKRIEADAIKFAVKHLVKKVHVPYTLLRPANCTCSFASSEGGPGDHPNLQDIVITLSGPMPDGEMKQNENIDAVLLV